MNIFKAFNRQNSGFSIAILNTLLFLVILLLPSPIIRSVKGSTLIVMAFIYLFYLAKKQGFTATPDKQSLYQQNSDIMNKYLTLKDLEVHNLETEISIKDTLYKQLFDFAPDAFIIFNNNNIVSYCNDACCKLLGIKDIADIISQDIWEFVHPKYMTIAKAAYSDLLTKSTDINIIDLKLLTFDNTVKEVKISSSITFFEENYYIFCCIHDLSAHNEQERIKVELENNIAHEKFKVECFANISHDIKTPINVIYSAIQLQEMYTDSNDYDKVLVYNNVIKQNCLRLQKLLNDVLDITKIDANHFKPNLEPCNIISSIEYITQSVTSYIEHNNISIIFDTNVEDKFALTDLGFIERIMLNLVSNAIKYGNQNGHVWVSLHDTDDHLIISIKDDGIGIPHEQISNIFKRFHKTNQSNASGVSSNGIGLSLVRSMVNLLDGSISCLSKEGDGSEFIVILPMASLEGDDLIQSEYAAALELNAKLNIEFSDL